jgi:hypothetical protein
MINRPVITTLVTGRDRPAGLSPPLKVGGGRLGRSGRLMILRLMILRLVIHRLVIGRFVIGLLVIRRPVISRPVP